MKTKTEKKRYISVAGVLTTDPDNSHLPEKKWTMEEAFDNLCETNGNREELNLERGIRSVAFLLSYVSEDGNTEVDGFIAEGLGKCLSFCAKESVRLRSFRPRWKQ
jgi:hypothetical protein